MSLPFISKNSGAAGKKTMLVATIAPVIAPTWLPPFSSLTARRGAFSPSASFTLSILMLSFPALPMRRFDCASVTVAQAPPSGNHNHIFAFDFFENLEIHGVSHLRVF